MDDLLEHAKRDDAHKHTGPHDEIRHNTDKLVIPMEPEVEVSIVQEEAPMIQANVREEFAQHASNRIVNLKVFHSCGSAMLSERVRGAEYPSDREVR
jgi:hypothetical protein